MQQFLNQIERICRIVSALSGINTVFVDSKGTRMVGYDNYNVPDLLRPYLKSVDSIYKISPETGEKDSADIVTVLLQSETHRLNFLLVPVIQESSGCNRVVVGPFLTQTPDAGLIQSVMQENNLPIPLRPIIKQYYQSIPLLTEYKISVLAECITGLTVNLSQAGTAPPHIRILRGEPEAAAEDTFQAIRHNRELYLSIVEKRYMTENRFMSAISHGDYPTLEKIFSEKGFLFQFADRIPSDPLRSNKNISFVFNTLYRKAAEYGGVHPIYLDSISEKFAILIEKADTLHRISEIQREMRVEYCELVRRFSLRQYSGLVRKIVEYIRLNLDRDLSVKTLARFTGSSPSSIIKKFRSETGETLSAFINHARIAESVRLMRMEPYSISQIATAVGFNDVNYFTKVFKKYQGATPSAYRKSMLRF